MTGDDPAGGSRETLTQLIARILDQLSVSSWLPAVFVVAAAVVYGNIAVNEGAIDEAFNSIAHIGGGSVALLLASVILTTVLTQAFEFEAIRTLEGYWGSGWLSRAMGVLPLRRQLRRLSQLERRRQALRAKAYAEIGVDERQPVEVRAAKQCLLIGRDADSDQPVAAEIASFAGWESSARPTTVRSLEAVQRELESFPSAQHLVLPTRLGNVLRAYEERSFPDAKGPLEGAVQRIFYRLPSTLQVEHDQFRNRLDLYCNMTLLCLLSGICGSAVLASVSWEHALAAAATNALFAWLFYRSAVASAAGYGQTLLSIADYGVMQVVEEP